MIRTLICFAIVALCIGATASPLLADTPLGTGGKIVQPPGGTLGQVARWIDEWWSSGYVFQRLVTVEVDQANGCKLKSAQLRRYNIVGDFVVVFSTTPVEVCKS